LYGRKKKESEGLECPGVHHFGVYLVQNKEESYTLKERKERGQATSRQTLVDPTTIPHRSLERKTSLAPNEVPYHPTTNYLKKKKGGGGRAEKE